MSDLSAFTSARYPLALHAAPRDSRPPASSKAMTSGYPTLASLPPYGLITPPSEMRSSTAMAHDDSAYAHSNILAPPANNRYYLRRQPVQPGPPYPIANGTYQHNPYNPYLQVRRGSASSSTTASSATVTSSTTTYVRAASPSLDFESRDFNVGEFTAAMVCFTWFEPISVIDYAAAFQEHAHLKSLADDSIPSQDFIDFCARVINTTAVSKEVAILSLLFIHRLRLRNPNVEGKSGSQWRIFTIALMLGNKILDDNTYTNKTWADVTKILHVQDIKIMEVEFLSQMRYNLFVSPGEWEDWKVTVSRMWTYHRDCLRQQRALPNRVFTPSIPPSPPVTNIATSPSFPEQQHSYLPMPGSPLRMHFPAQQQVDRMASPHRLHPMDDSPSSASAAIHARVSRKRSREDTSTLPPPPKRYQPQQPPPQQSAFVPGPLGIHLPQPQRMAYPTDTINHSIPPPQQTKPPPRVSLSLSLPDQTHSPSYLQTLQPISPTNPTSPFAASPLSPFSQNSNYNSLSPYAVSAHRQLTQQPSSAENSGGYASGYSSPYKYLTNRFSPYAPVRPARTIQAQFVPPQMQWNMLPTQSEELWYQPLGLHGSSGLRRGVPSYPEYNPGYAHYPPPPPPHPRHP